MRFPCSHQLVNYKTAYEAGEALLLNVSTAGCAFLQPSLPLSMHEKTLISIALPGEDTALEAQGVVMRVDNTCTAIHFTLIEPGDQARIRKYFSKMMREK